MSSGVQIEHAAELAQCLVEHSSLIKRDAEVPVLVGAAAHLGVDVQDVRRLADPVDEAGGEETVERLADLELHEPRGIDDRLDIARAVDELEYHPLLVGQLGVGRQHLGAVHLEDDVEGWNLLLDESPFIDAARALEQQRLRVDRHDVVM